jgi:hypothetical protein
MQAFSPQDPDNEGNGSGPLGAERITSHWIGQIIRRKFGLKAEERRGCYEIGLSEMPKLARLFEKLQILTEPGDFGDFSQAQDNQEC